MLVQTYALKTVGKSHSLTGQNRDHKLALNYRTIFRQGRQAGRRDGGLTRPRPLSVTAGNAQGARGGQAAARRLANRAGGSPLRGRQACRFYQRRL
jgi:hypothetical protein